MVSTARHTSAHTSPMDGVAFGTLAKHAGHIIREGIAALITHKVLQLSNNKKSGL